MSQTNERVAEAFSRHRFDETSEFLAEDVRWNNVGGDQFAGRQAVIDACAATTTFLADVTTTFARFRVVADESRVVVDVVAEYADGANPPSTVSSCDIYEFADGRIVEITSYTAELTATS